MTERPDPNNDAIGNHPARGSARGSRWFTAGCIVLIPTALMHSAATLAPMPELADEDGATLMRLSREYVLKEIGRTLVELMKGYSWWFALALGAMGAGGLAIRRGRAYDAELLRSISIINTATLALGLVISLTFFFIIPSTCLGLAAACFTIAAFRTRS